jgi:hypothetical protein
MDYKHLKKVLPILRTQKICRITNSGICKLVHRTKIVIVLEKIPHLNRNSAFLWGSYFSVLPLKDKNKWSGQKSDSDCKTDGDDETRLLDQTL